MPHAAVHLPFVPPAPRTAFGAGSPAPASPPARMAEPARRIAVRSARAYRIIAIDTIVRISADDNYVVVTADRDYRQKCTLDAFRARLDPVRFVRVHRSHAVNTAAVRELAALGRGEFRLALRDGTTMRTGRRFAAVVVTTFGLDA
jgi:DNA-binding LytR/AlgR family response regulator